MNTNQRKLIAALSLCAAVVPNLASAVAISGQGTWESTLQGRDLDGNLATFEAYYDTALNITWLADANYAITSGYDADGRINWYSAIDWANSLNPYYSGITGWRLPVITDTSAPGCDFAYAGTDCGANVDTTTSEMAHLFYVTLGNLSRSDGTTGGPGSTPQPGWGLTNTGPFSNLQARLYQSSTTYALQQTAIWNFNFYDGYQYVNHKNDSNYVWAVHSGDVGIAIPSAVPIPAATWLFGSGLLGMVGIAKRKRVA